MADMALDTSGQLDHIEKRSSSRTSVADVETLVYTYYDAVHRLALSILDDEQEADDATQETFIAAASSLDDYRGEASVKTWLFAIAINECRSLLRKRKRRQRVLDALQTVQSWIAPPPSPEERTVQSEKERRLRAAVLALPEKQQFPVLLRYVHNLTAAEIAQVLDVSEGTVYSRLHYARRQLRRLLRE